MLRIIVQQAVAGLSRGLLPGAVVSAADLPRALLQVVGLPNSDAIAEPSWTALQQRGFAAKAGTEPPRRPPTNPYALFTKQTYKESAVQAGSTNAQVVAGHISAKWRSLSAAERQAWQKAADEGNKEYNAAKAVRKEINAKHKTGYQIFLAQEMSAVLAQITHLKGQERTHEAVRRIAASWKTLSDAQKAPFNDTAKSQRESARR